MVYHNTTDLSITPSGLWKIFSETHFFSRYRPTLGHMLAFPSPSAPTPGLTGLIAQRRLRSSVCSAGGRSGDHIPHHADDDGETKRKRTETADEPGNQALPQEGLDRGVARYDGSRTARRSTRSHSGSTQSRRAAARAIALAVAGRRPCWTRSFGALWSHLSGGNTDGDGFPGADHEPVREHGASVSQLTWIIHTPQRVVGMAAALATFDAPVAHLRSACPDGSGLRRRGEAASQVGAQARGLFMPMVAAPCALNAPQAHFRSAAHPRHQTQHK